MKSEETKSFEKTINLRLNETIDVLQKSKSLVLDIERAAEIILECFKSGNKLLICGNGGSAADAQHIAAEFVGKFYRIDRPALPALALHTNTSIITAIGNDFGYDGIFTRQVEAWGKSGDILLGISTSGNSRNIIDAAEFARTKNMKVITLTGANPCKLDLLSDIALKIPSTNTPIIQNIHISICHIICELVESCV